MSQPEPLDQNKPVCPLTVGDVGRLYNAYVSLLNFSALKIPMWDGLNAEQQGEVVALAAELLYMDGEAISSNFTDLFHNRLGTLLFAE